MILGMQKAGKLSYRVNLIEFFIFFFRELKNEVSFLTNSVNDFLFSFPESELTKNYKENIENGMEFPDAFKEAVFKMNLKEAEKEILIDFSENFGSFGRENSICDIDYYIEKLKVILENAKAEKREKTKITVSLSLCVAFCIVIFAL